MARYNTFTRLAGLAMLLLLLMAGAPFLLASPGHFPVTKDKHQEQCPPVFDNLPADETIECGPVPAPPAVTASSCCTISSITFQETVQEFSKCHYIVTRQWTATDECGYVTTGVQHITVEEKEPPTLMFVHPDLVGLMDGDTFKISCTKPIIFDLNDVFVQDNCDKNPVIWMDEKVLENKPCRLLMKCTFIAVDECDNYGSLSFYYFIGDDVPPALEGVPNDLTLSCEEPVPPPANVTATDNCPGPIPVQFTQHIIPGACPQEYMIIRQWTAQDSCGNTATASHKITIVDDLAPVLTPVDPLLIGLQSGDTLFFDCDGLVVLGPDAMSASDNCDDVQIVFEETIMNGNCAADGFILKMNCSWTATDACGNSTSFAVVILVRDLEAPVLSIGPKDITLSCDEPLPADPDVTATDNCDGDVPVTKSEEIIPGACPQAYVRILTWTATDACGNSASVECRITVIDEEAPVFSDIPAHLTIECSEVPNLEHPLVSDNCDPEPDVVFTEKIATGNCTGDYLIIRQWMATDACGNTAMAGQIITVTDTTPPVFYPLPADITASCEDVPEPAVVEISDACDPAPALDFKEVREDGHCPDAYTLLRIWTATDDCGNVAVATQTITVVDETAPEIFPIPEDLTLSCEMPLPSPPSVKVLDNCDPDPQISMNAMIMPGACPQEYMVVQEWIAEDRCGNLVSIKQTITVVDEQAPEFGDIPESLTLECDQLLPSDMPEVTDLCDPQPVVTLVETSIPGHCPQAYTLLRTWTATDACGNSSQAQQEIEVTDTTPPTIMTVHPGLNGVNSGDTLYYECDQVIIYGPHDVKATDNCDPNPVVTFHEIITKGDCLTDGFILEMRCTWTATDACGNSNSFYIVVRITDQTPPTISDVPADLTLSCEQPLPPLPDVSAEDNCDDQVTLELTEKTIPGACDQSYTLIRQWTATDDCGNTAMASQTITVLDQTPPVLIGIPQDLTLSCEEGLPDPDMVSAADNCDPNPTIVIKEVREDGPCPQSYMVLRLWEATDNCGNKAVGSQKITVVDQTAPELEGVPADVTINCDAQPGSAMVSASDNCDPQPVVTLEEETIPGHCPQSYILVRTWTATDACGNSQSAVWMITVQDTTPPNFVYKPKDITVTCQDSVPGPPNMKAWDDCDPQPVVTVSSELIPGACPQSYTVIHTWEATDACGNVATMSQQVSVVDEEAPIWLSLPEDLTVECDQVPPADQPDVTDLCDPQPVVTLEETSIPGHCPQAYTLVRTWTATDACGNSTQAQQHIEVTDTTPPTIMTVHPGLNGVNSGDTLYYECDQVIIYGPNDVKATDNCDPNPVVTFHEIITKGDCLTDGFLLEMRCTWTATDACGNSSSFHIVVRITDHTPPTISGVPADLNLSCDQPLPPLPDVIAEDNCDDQITVVLTEKTIPGPCDQSYTLILQWTATDDCGNTAIASQTITVIDQTPPVLIGVPQDLTLSCEEGLPDPDMVSAIDICDPNPTIILKEVREDGPCPQSYTLLRLWQSTDDCGNMAVASQTITVVDHTAPELVGVPEDAMVACDAVPAPAMVTAADNCDADPVITFDEQRVDGSCPDNYALIRTWTATDACGNSSKGVQQLVVMDTIAPVFTLLPADLTLYCQETWPDPVFEVRDQCASTVHITIIEEGGIACDAEEDRRYIIATDACGNTAVAVQHITLIDTVPPVFEPFDNKVFLPCDAIQEIPVPEATDDCDPAVTVSFTDQVLAGNCPQEYTIIRTWKATDACGNMTTAIQLIHLFDDQAPELMTDAPVLQGVPSGSTLTLHCTQLPLLGPDAFTATDNCDPDPTITFDEIITSGDCLTDGYFLKMICSWTATDACGNSSSYTITILITDNEAPYFTSVPADLTLDCTDALPGGDALADDDCTAVSVSLLEEQEDLDCGYILTRTWTAVDGCGNTAQAVQTITVEDNSAPVFLTMVEDLTVEPEKGDTIPGIPTVEAEDACSDLSITLTVDEEPLADCGYILIRTWVAEDACGNTAALQQRITVLEACPCVEPEVETILLVEPDCDQANGAITILTTGNNASYTYQWVPDKGVANAEGNSRTGLEAGSYLILIEDTSSKNCFSKVSVVLEKGGSCIDTIPVSTGIEEPLEVCVGPFLDFDGNLHSASLCGYDAAAVDVTLIPGSDCLLLTPAAGFTGVTEICVIHCNDATPEVCDTTIILLTVNGLQPCDPMFTNSAYQFQTADCEAEISACLLVPFAQLSEYQILINGELYSGPATACGVGSTAIRLGVGEYEVEITHLPSQCFDARYMKVSCQQSETLIAIDDQVQTRKNRAVAISPLSNDLIPAGNVITDLRLTSLPLQGLVVPTENFGLIYTPSKDFCGQEQMTYEICVGDALCAEAVITVEVDCSGLIVKTGFSPNGDGINDFLFIEGIEHFPNNELTVYNRWGNQVYFQRGYSNNWDGIWNGRVLPDGTYYYFLKDGEGEVYSGYVQIGR